VKFPGLTAGTYKLRYTDCGGFGFGAPVWYESKSGFAGATVVSADWPLSPDDFPTVTQTLKQDTTPPGLPTLDSTNPASGANENNPEVIGTSEPGSSVQLYTDASCTTPIGSSTPAGGFAAPGITVGVADNSVTTFYAKATDAADNASGCSTDSITYAESTPSTLPDDPDDPDDSACTAARAKLTAATMAKSKATAALKTAKAHRKPKPKIAKLKRKAKTRKKAMRAAAAEVKAACV
jgi:hypothetical protein